MIIAIILILVAVALFLIFHDDHDDSYTRGDSKLSRNPQKSTYQKNVDKGTASVTVRGTGVYGGTKKVTFTIGTKKISWWQRLLNNLFTLSELRI